MLTQEQALAELRQLNMELGLAEDDGIPMTQAQAEAELRKLDEELASTPESFDEYVTRRKQEDSRSIGEKTSAFTDSFLTGAGTLAQEGGRAIKQLFSGGVGAKELKGVFQVGIEDFGRFAKTLGGAAMDNFYSDEEEMKREYERYKDNFLYNQNVRTAMLNTFDEEGRDFVSFGANFVDPTMLVPVAGQAAKLGAIGLKSARLGKLANAIEKGGAIASKPTELVAKGTRKAIEKTAQVGSKIAGATSKAGEVTAKAAAFPRNVVTSLAGKAIDPKVAGSGILGAQVTGAFTGAVPGLGLLTSAEVAGYIANKSGRGMERVLTALGSEAGQKRFLQRLALQADSPTTRKLALYAHKLGGTRMGDLAFNSLVNGISVSTLNGALAYASTDNIEELGQAMGAGFAMGGALPVGQPGMRAGKSQAARNQSSVNFLEAKLGQDQLKQFRKMDPDARLAFATVEEAGIKAPKLMFVDKDLMLKTLREDDPNIRQAPNAYLDQKDNTIYINENGRASNSSKEAFDILTHELGHGFITQAIKDDPLFARKILEQYEAKPGEKAFEFAFTTDSAGAPIDSIMLNEKAKKIASAYDNIQEGDKSIGVGQNANTLAQEIGAEQFAMMMVDNPNYFNTIEPSLRQKLLEGSRKVLTLFGAVDGNTGNPLDVSISPLLKRNKTIRNLYKNYTKQRDASIADKIDLAEKGVSMKVRKGESADQAVERLYGKQGISLREAGAFRIDNKKVKNELTNILNRVDETPEGGMSSERNPKSGRPQAIVGKQLSDEVKGVFTRKDPRGTINMLINDITESIRNRLQLNFLYRSGKPSKYSDNELRARVVSPVRFKVTGLSKTSRSAASLKMDAIDEAYLRNNVEVLVKEGFADNPNDLIELARKVAREALDDEEGRINPQGNYENELVTAVFGQPESAPQIRNAKLRQLLEDKKLQHAYRSYDVDALAGLVPTGKSGIAFDWFNIKNNYSPFDDKLFMPKPEADVQITDKLFMPASEAGAGKGKQAEAAKLWQEKGTDSPYFKKWFGNSKVVDENGEPLVVYRGDRPGKEVFTGRENPYNLIQGNVFFSDNAEVAKFYTNQRTNYLISPEQMNEADGLYGTYLSLKKPLEVDAKENSWTDIPDPFNKGTIQIDDLGEIAQKKGYDGMIIKNVYDQGGFGTQYIAFSPEQIKSATGNRGTFDAGERNILFMPQLAMQNDPNVKYHYDTKTMDQPPVKTITALSGERLAGVLEADRHDARGSRMAGPAHPFLKSNQVTATVDGIEWKPVWANMKYQFVKTQIGKQLNSTNGYNLVAIMDEFAHRSNRDVFTRMMKKIQTASRKMTPEQKIITAQIINIFDIRYTPKKERTQSLQSSMDSFISDLGTAKSQATRGNLDGFNQLLNKAISKVEGKSWWSDNNVKSNSKDFRKYTKDMTFNKRGAILKALEGLPWLPDIQKFLKSEMDFEGAPTDKAILAVQLSKHKLNSDERVFAIYTGKDPEQAKWMTDNERKVLKQLRANPKFREHPSYDWMMLGRADADNFYLDQPVNLDKLIPSYRSDHKTFKKQEYKDQLSKAQKYFKKNPRSKGFLFSGKGDKADKAFIKTFLETKSKRAGIENVYKGKERLVVGAMKRNSKVPIIIP